MSVYQDGATFYDDATGNVIFTSSIRVTDFDLNAAELARVEFFAFAFRELGIPAHRIEFV